MNFLFICTANKDRSRTAEVKYSKHKFRSGGIEKTLCQAHGGIYVDDFMCEIADRIICMKNIHANFLINEFGNDVTSKIEVLGIDDREEYMSQSLIDELKMKIKI